jgi:hypothetical protein
MAQNYFKKSFIVLFLTLFIAPLISAASWPITSLMANDGGKQIIFMVDGPELKLTDVKISGTNQNGEAKTWEKHDSAGFRMAYTKDWWWSENFIQIDFSFQDGNSLQSISKTCLIDVLEQPSDTPRVEIIYFKDQGCAGGEAGNSRNQIADPFKQKARQVKDAFKTIEFYLSDFDEQVFIETFLYLEVNATVCAVGVGTAIESGGLSYALAAASVTSSCERTGRKILQTFFVEP